MGCVQFGTQKDRTVDNPNPTRIGGDEMGSSSSTNFLSFFTSFLTPNDPPLPSHQRLDEDPPSPSNPTIERHRSRPSSAEWSDIDEWRRASMNRRDEEVEQMPLVQRLRRIAGNQICADCDSRNPLWASVNLKVIVCSRCIGVHRRLGTHISLARSLYLDKWTEDEIAAIEQSGNLVRNRELEALIESNETIKPTSASHMNLIEDFIVSKYLHRSFSAGGSGQLIVRDRPRSASTLGIEGGRNVGMLVLSQLSARGIPKLELFGSADCYVIAQLSNTSQKEKTEIAKGTLNPIWRRTFTFNVQSKRQQCVKLTVMHHNNLARDELVGEALLSLVALPHSKISITLPLALGTGAQVRGEITLSALYTEFS